MSSIIAISTVRHSLHQDSTNETSLRVEVSLALAEGVPVEWQPHLQECVPPSSDPCRCVVFVRPTLTDEWRYVQVGTC
jgi:hypothetical protein